MISSLLTYCFITENESVHCAVYMNMWILLRPVFKVLTMFSEIHGFEDIIYNIILLDRSRWPCGLKRWSATACLLGWCVRIPPGTCLSVFRECCVLSDIGFCVDFVTGPEESHRQWCVWVWLRSLGNEVAPVHYGLLHRGKRFRFLSFRRVLNVIYSFLGNSPASEF